MRTALITHPACLGHATPLGHPESPDRLRAILRALEGEAFMWLIRESAPLATDEQLARVHGAGHITDLASLEPAEAGDWTALDADTVMSAGSMEAARRAAGAVVAGVEGVLRGDYANAFCAVRPPGHHAEPDRAMGFCLFNNAAVGALHARTLGLRRVAVVDFDVHHGNGSQTLAMRDPDFFYGSIHEGGAYPGTGFAHETAHGNLANAPVPPGTAGPAWREAFEAGVLASLARFAPELIVVSAGFDAHRADPLAALALTEADFAWATRRLMDIAAATCGGKLVSTLEGGYHLGALARSTEAHVRTLMDG
jgi:acetoin utilization deacetylase AcuC-like enzyme